jgi:hypothetical protein
MPPRVPAEDQPRMPLDRRVPGETDLSVFTTAIQRAGRHRPDPSRHRVVRDGPDGRPLLRALASPEGRRAAARMAAASSLWRMRPPHQDGTADDHSARAYG